MPYPSVLAPAYRQQVRASPPPPPPPPPPPGTGTVATFFGDSGNSGGFQDVLNLARDIGSQIVGHCGDFDYSTSFSSHQSWIAKQKATLGASFPFLGISGNHDSQLSDYQNVWGLPSGLIVGENLVRYYCDFPTGSPVVRIIGVTPGVNEIPRDSDYSIGTANGVWLQGRIREAKAMGLWVVVIEHKNWIDLAGKSNEVGTSFIELCLTEGVDFCFQGHSHIYARTKQFGTPVSGTTPAIRALGPTFQRGNGTVIIITGAGGVGTRSIDFGDPDVGKFADLVGGQGGKAAFTGSFGCTQLTIQPTRIDGRYHLVNARNVDSFSME